VASTTDRRSASSGTPSRASRKVSEPHFVILVDSVFFSGDLEKFAKMEPSGFGQ